VWLDKSEKTRVSSNGGVGEDSVGCQIGGALTNLLAGEWLDWYGDGWCGGQGGKNTEKADGRGRERRQV